MGAVGQVSVGILAKAVEWEVANVERFSKEDADSLSRLRIFSTLSSPEGLLEMVLWRNDEPIQLVLTSGVPFDVFGQDGFFVINEGLRFEYRVAGLPKQPITPIDVLERVNRDRDVPVSKQLAQMMVSLWLNRPQILDMSDDVMLLYRVGEDWLRQDGSVIPVTVVQELLWNRDTEAVDV